MKIMIFQLPLFSTLTLHTVRYGRLVVTVLYLTCFQQFSTAIAKHRMFPLGLFR